MLHNSVREARCISRLTWKIIYKPTSADLHHCCMSIITPDTSTHQLWRWTNGGNCSEWNVLKNKPTTCETFAKEECKSVKANQKKNTTRDAYLSKQHSMCWPVQKKNGLHKLSSSARVLKDMKILNESHCSMQIRFYQMGNSTAVDKFVYESSSCVEDKFLVCVPAGLNFIPHIKFFKWQVDI